MKTSSQARCVAELQTAGGGQEVFPPEEAARRALAAVHQTNTSFLSQFCVCLRRKRSVQCFSRINGMALFILKKETVPHFDFLRPSSGVWATPKSICFFAQFGFRWTVVLLLLWYMNAELTLTLKLAANPPLRAVFQLCEFCFSSRSKLTWDK